MTSQQKRVEQEWNRWRKQLISSFFAKPSSKDIIRTATLALLAFSLLLNAAQADTINLMESKLDEINEAAMLQNGWVWFDVEAYRQ